MRPRNAAFIVADMHVMIHKPHVKGASSYTRKLHKSYF
jgi:hypothetical protein